MKNKEGLIWHVQELFLAQLADILKSTFGGYVLTHLHIIPWKFNIEYNENHFKKLYSQWLNNTFNLISENYLEKTAYPLSDKIISVSHSAMKHIVSAYNIPPDKIHIIYNGLDNIDIPPIKSKEELPELLFVGRVSREKGIICLLNALNIVDYRGYSFKLRLVGQCTSCMLSYIQKVYKQLNLEILGAVSFDKLKKLYSESTIGIVPSLHEQCSYVAIEMSMFGMPMIVSDVDALSEMFEDEVNALKIPLVFDEDFGLELDEEKLANAIIRLINDKALRLKLSTNAIKNYQERFTLEKMIENTINVYEQLIEQDNA
ncbi:glycosyltransferase family 4 protein [Bacteroides thetaiotaomicron]|uniref:glycosyltransferase family 4 protein n=1 Tax=Bacteroides thetaiotaomicron TaxID=818 RepID=UPI001E3D2552|nr:glycosyltransferase family 4 protein [Bacteroides thetaiotaomicron]MDC2230980.1 glycosyltransferase family 4 protein [Bacteroides thetaiotaomicron]